MCGIAGEIRFDGRPASVDRVQQMCRRLAPRGPDDSGIHAHGPCALGHRRLQIIDLSRRGRQPMEDPQLGLTIAFNGCIYNHRELRRELTARGYRFFSNSDTEVILKAWHAWGEKAVERMNGMFAFAIHERDSGDLVLVRDRLGIKPLYLGKTPGALRFASTLPALLAGRRRSPAVDPIGLHHYMTFHSVVPAPRTILKGIVKLPPATIMRFSAAGMPVERRYWSPRYDRDDAPPMDENEWRETVHEQLRAAVRRRLTADVDVGVLLSGGLDSSLIVALLAEHGESRLQTFSIGFEDAGGERGNEFKYSDAVAAHFATDHHQLRIDSGTLLEHLPQCLAAMSEPMVSHDNIGFFLLSREVSRHVKVVQSGQGADEIFGGYDWYPPMMDSRDPVTDYRRVFFDRDHREYGEAVAPALVGDDHSRLFVERHFGRPGADAAIDKAMRLDTTVMLVEDPVKRVDNMTMAWGLEARVPFLDHRVVETAAALPPALKIGDGGKYILKQIGRRLLPRKVVERPKGYFPVPALKYVNGRTLDFARDVLGARPARERGLFRRAYLERLLAEPERHITPLKGSKLWQVVALEAWLQQHGVAA